LRKSKKWEKSMGENLREKRNGERRKYNNTKQYIENFVQKSVNV
jgi:hypothetical protein